MNVGPEELLDPDARWEELRVTLTRVREASDALAPRAARAMEASRILHQRGESDARDRVTDLHSRLDQLESELTGLRTAMLSRAVIEQAKGMIMLRDKCGADDAFATLVRVSQSAHLKLRDVAERVVEWGSGVAPDPLSPAVS